MKLKYIANGYVVTIVLMLFSTYPYVFDMLLGLPDEKVMNGLFAGLSLFIFLFITKKGQAFPPTVVLWTMCFQCLSWLIFGLFHNDSSYTTRAFFLIFTFLVLSILCSKRSIIKFGFFYNCVFAFISLLGVVAFVLAFLNILSPFLVLERGSKFIFFYGLTCSNDVYGNFMRVGGFFDEPGALASWGVFALVINKLIYNNKKIEWILIISLLFTFSAAYFVLLPLYLLFFYHKRLKQLLIILLLLIPVGFFVFSELGENDYFRYMTTDRFEGGNIRSKRTDYAEYTKTIFSQNVLMGVGGRKIESLSIIEQTSDNPYEIFAKDGIIGYIVTYIPLVVLCVVFRRKKEVILGSLLLFLCYQQRPFHINEMHFFMIFFYMTLVFYKYKGISCEKELLNKLSFKL